MEINDKKVKILRSAWCEDLNRRITIGFENIEKVIRPLSQKRALTCPNCGAKVILKAGEIMTHHFAHWDENSSNCFDPYYEVDGPEHQLMKQTIVSYIRQFLPDAFVEMEVPIEETGQRADVLVIPKYGPKIAIEMQVSSITASEWRERHNLYRSVNIIDVWLLGYSRLHVLDSLAYSKSYNPLTQNDLTRCRIKFSYGLSELEKAITLESKKLLYLDVLSSIKPRIIYIGELNLADYRGLAYDLPLIDKFVKIHPEYGLFTSVDIEHNSLISNKRYEEIEERVNLAWKWLENRATRGERKAEKIKKRLVDKRVDAFLKTALTISNNKNTDPPNENKTDK